MSLEVILIAHHPRRSPPIIYPESWLQKSDRGNSDIVYTRKSILTMSPKYAKDQPAGFANSIKKVAIVGVSQEQLREPQHSRLTR